METTKKHAVSKRAFTGVVVAAKMAKTVTVRVDRTAFHKKYGKQFALSRKFKIHDEKGECKVGDVVDFEETRPISKDKRWRVTKIVTRAAVADAK